MWYATSMEIDLITALLIQEEKRKRMENVEYGVPIMLYEELEELPIGDEDTDEESSRGVIVIDI